mmetsp:Transcript_68709/g.183056  ORF Transcript_68709/g.183056 Transcript_68709/m.183056 type:complete len:428 (+) Transcript_68709:14-1297(+)
MSDVRFFQGIAINIVGSTVINVGTNLMKYGGRAKPMGILLFAIGNGVSFASFSFAPQSVLAAVSAVQFVSNVVMTFLLFGEKPTARIWLGTAVIILGNLLIVLSSPGHNDDLDATTLLRDYWRGRMRMLFFLGLVTGFWFLAFLFGKLYAMSPLPIGLCGWPRIESREDRSVLNNSLMPAIIFVFMSAMAGSQSVVHGKVVSIQLGAMAAGTAGAAGLGPLIVVVVFWAAMISLWMVQLGRALSIFNGVFVIPLTQACWIAWSIISGGITFQEFDGFTPVTGLGFTAGVSLLFLGIGFMAPRNHRTPKNQQLAATVIEGESIVVFSMPESNSVAAYMNLGGMPFMDAGELVPEVLEVVPFHHRSTIAIASGAHDTLLSTVEKKRVLNRVASLPSTDTDLPWHQPPDPNKQAPPGLRAVELSGRPGGP